MNKQEFETMIGKEVSYETFRMYEDMYMSCPENITKQKFVEMLNIEAIPESKEAIERRERAAAFEEQILEQINSYKKSIKFWKEHIKDLQFSLALAKECDQKEDVKYVRECIKNAKEQIEWNRQQVSQLEFILA